MFLGWAVLTTLAIGIALALCVQAVWRHYFDSPEIAGSAPDAETVGESAAPARGVTGTTALPALPAFAVHAMAGGPGLVAARPFSMAGASAIDRGRALDCLATAIYFEAATEPDAGQQAVAQVILNRVRHPAFPPTICGVVYQGADRAGCQFSFACDRSMARKPVAAAWARAVRAAATALSGRVFADVGLATHYHTFAVTPGWNRAMVMTDAVGAHFFHRWKGYWGTPAAFTQAYLGREPIPGTYLPPSSPPVVQTVETKTEAKGPVVPAMPPAAAAVVPSSSSTPLPEAAGDHLPPASEILDRWKDSGKPLR